MESTEAICGRAPSSKKFRMLAFGALASMVLSAPAFSTAATAATAGRAPVIHSDHSHRLGIGVAKPQSLRLV